MEIKKYFQSAIQQIEADKQRQIAIVKDRVVREKITPYNQDVDKLRNESIAKLTEQYDKDRATYTAQYNEKLVALQKKFEADKQTITQLAEEKKAQNLNSVLATETYAITSECDKAIAKLKSICDEIKE